MLDVIESDRRIDNSRAIGGRLPSRQVFVQSDQPTAPDIGLGDVLHQVKRDLLAKEVQTSPTYSYQWMADQAGHIGLGLLIVLCTWWARQFADPGQWSWIPIVGAFLGSLCAQIGQLIDSIAVKVGISSAALSDLPVWIGFAIAVVSISLLELYDYWQASKKLETLFDATRDRTDLRQNVGAAIGYVSFGAVVAVLALLSFPPLLMVPFVLLTAFFPWLLRRLPDWLRQKTLLRQIALLILSPLLLARADHWLRQKMRFQQAGLPFLFRLPEFKLDGFSREDAQQIDDFIRTSGDASPKHIAIIGEIETGKTMLAVGIGTEASFSKKKVRYLTFSKLTQIAHLRKEPDPPRNLVFWPWQESQILVIDDVVSGLLHSKVDSPEQLQEQLQSDLGDALQSIRRRYTVWCLGAEVSNKWIEALREGSGIDKRDLIIIKLQKHPHKPDRVFGRMHRYGV